MTSKHNQKPRQKTFGVMDYLQSSLSRDALLELYLDDIRGPDLCRAVTQRALSATAQQVTMRLGTVQMAPRADVQVWLKRGENHLTQVLQELYGWGVIVESDNGTAAVQLTAQFQQALQTAIRHLDTTSGWTILSDELIKALEQEEKETMKNKITPYQLEQFTQTCWDAVLHFMVGSTSYPQEPPPAVVHFLLQTKLMQADPEFKGDTADAPLVITTKGYDFMLQEQHEQVWHFVSKYLESLLSHEKGPTLVREALLLLVSMSFCRVGQCFLSSQLNKHGRALVKDLALFGLVCLEKIGKYTLVYPTRVALQLVAPSQSITVSRFSKSSHVLQAALQQPTPSSTHLAIIVQTNFQVCAYTTSELHVSMLALFCDVQTIRRLPNIVFLMITRDSVQSALALGIQATQILRFLEQHSHPQLRTSSASAVPANIRDQIWLWEKEKRRLVFTQVYSHQCVWEGELEAIREQFPQSCVWTMANRILLDYRTVKEVQAFVAQFRATKSQQS